MAVVVPAAARRQPPVLVPPIRCRTDVRPRAGGWGRLAGLRRAPRLVLIALIGYVLARLARAEWAVLTDPSAGLLDVRTVMAGVGRSFVNGLAGLVVLVAINFALVRFYPKPRGSNRTVPDTL